MITEENQEMQQELNEILKIRRDKLAQLQNDGADPYRKTRYERTAYTKDIVDNFDTMEGKPVSIAGRLMSKRGMGTASFADLRDRGFVL